jgi:glycosyltransferase involved in cell wall biosynthesis
VRDAAPWLGECLASIAAQSEGDYEVLAVDDGSRDGSAAMLREVARCDTRVRILGTRASQRGLVAALNAALAAASAPVLVRMDADDRMHPQRLALQLAALDADPSLLAVASRARAFPAESVGEGMRAYIEWQNSLLLPEHLSRDRFIESPVLHPTVALRTDRVRERLGGWRETPWPEDWDFFQRAFEQDLRIARLPEVLLEWRQHQGQATRTGSRYRAEALVEARAHFLARRLAPEVAAGRGIWILGAGPVGKELVKALAGAGVVADGLADVDPRKIGGVVRGGGRNWRVVDHAGLRTAAPRPFAVSAVSGAAARARVRGELQRWGWTEGMDFVVAA